MDAENAYKMYLMMEEVERMSPVKDKIACGMVNYVNSLKKEELKGIFKIAVLNAATTMASGMLK